ncbi:MAG: UDP-N-acetylmuramate dehydrogenase [Pseudodesulfovibrio sp.]|uniref:UDP-N-acetylenolpyruvoylglucosamine reductase n=1 Tax=Pseudodesulfovibrio aespoeensis (strain ATCC 700646 / DSM 10631 / Aspo-2) TaxID=643562 RepID=E6VXG2_PSEA9|nr:MULTISPECIES: UDP-N-acetylmuramate dehydrogenase [Pseudodesulfovibrio]MBU4190872.1 UDP-N-acetylmuramate dehydrogenase [Pseudomonadota bacterium]ADU63778.1 UDP-N-acetylenolpyruvoylglucosamine reductase [Pseudodesulfovibrio aespoeensis Aspo-2]MBU4242868.1 UDP-N-acetylmuramate dehydrogenase [Pseudomonadota bacterium]MBU4379714.1 UDP-N-acetylmuramate dehydrogenase [Pseudomonadota bacterium]MBU4475694.1 UDP-N-acetylmuramate dehydrogenase [Pseudomonadota bacterium]
MALELIPNPSLAQRTTLRLGGSAEVEAVVRDERDLDDLGGFLATQTLRPFVIGRGSNLLAREGQLDLALIRVGAAPGPLRVERANDRLMVRCCAAQGLPGLLGWAQKAGLSGLEGLTGIPGSVGGAVAMNAGSYGVEFGDLVTRVRLWSPAGGLDWVDAADCAFSYRHFSSPARPAGRLVWEVEIGLTESTPRAVRKAMQGIYDKKRATQPVTARSAGCVFKNPEGESAGRLLDEAGLKGVSRGGMAFSDIHANFLINLGGGTSAQALELIELGRESVRTAFGVTLETEVIIL